MNYGIFDYKELIEFEGDQLQFAKVVFTRNFGPFLRGEHCAQVKIDFENLILYELTEGGALIRSCKLRLEPQQ